MKKLTLNAKERKITGKKTKQLRTQGIIPVVLYGQKLKTQNLEIAVNEFEKVYRITGVNNLFDLKISDKSATKVLIHDVQRNPITDEVIHADIYAVRDDQKLKTEIPLHFTGKSKAVEEKEGNLITHKDALEVEVLPGDLVEEIKVDISTLKTFDDVIKIKDINIPQEIEVLAEKDDIIANVTPPRSEEELEALDEEVEEDVEGVEVEKEKKDEGEESEIKEGEESSEDKKDQPKTDEAEAQQNQKNQEPPTGQSPKDKSQIANNK